MSEFIQIVLKVFLHLDRYLAEVVNDYGVWTHALLFSIVFCETGLVFTPFLPGDSLLFAVGALSAKGILGGWFAFVHLSIAAILGDSVNYWIGRRFGAFLIRRHSRWIRKDHIDKTHAFFEKYGGGTIILARFVPIVRTFAPFVAGMGAMGYRQFFAYNVIGGLAWVTLCLGAGFLFGKHPVVQDNFSLVILAIVFVSILPGIVGYVLARRRAKLEALAGGAGRLRPAGIAAAEPAAAEPAAAGTAAADTVDAD